MSPKLRNLVETLASAIASFTDEIRRNPPQHAEPDGALLAHVAHGLGCTATALQALRQLAATRHTDEDLFAARDRLREDLDNAIERANGAYARKHARERLAEVEDAIDERAKAQSETDFPGGPSAQDGLGAGDRVEVLSLKKTWGERRGRILAWADSDVLVQLENGEFLTFVQTETPQGMLSAKEIAAGSLRRVSLREAHAGRGGESPAQGS